MAEQRKSHPLKYYFQEFEGGLATQEQPNKIRDNQSPDMLNVRPLGRGAYGPRNGISRVGNKVADTGSIKNIYNFSRFDRVGLETLVRSRSTTLEYLNNSEVWTAIPGVPTYDENALFGFAQGLDVSQGLFYLYGCNAVNSFFRWDGGTRTPTVFTAATDDVITSVAHGLNNGDRIYVANSGGALPGGLSANTPYYVIEKTADTFKVSTTFGGSAVDITNTGTGTHTFSNNIREYPNNPKGNILEFYLRRLFITGITATPATVFYSVIGQPDNFSGGGSGNFVVGDSGDKVTALRAFTDPESSDKTLLVYKASSRIYGVKFDSSGNISIQELVIGSGARNQKSTIVIENDIYHIDQGNNIVNLGFRENLQNKLRTDPSTTHLDTITSRINFDNAAAVYFKLRRMAIWSGKDFGSEFNDLALVYFYDFNSWWLWKGISANEFAIYQNEIVWASSSDPNVYKYDESKFDDDFDETGEAGAGAIRSYRHTKDIEYADENGILLGDRYKQPRFAIVRGYIHESGQATIGLVADGNLNSPVQGTFSGSDEGKILSETISVSLGSVVFGAGAFGGASLGASEFPMREFLAILSLDGYSNIRARVNFEVQVAGTPYIITMISLHSSLEPEEKWSSESKI